MVAAVRNRRPHSGPAARLTCPLLGVQRVHGARILHRVKTIWTMTWLLLTPLAWAGGPVFDSHVHLREGETSLREYETKVREAGIELSSLAVMWFGGPHQAL